MTIVNQVLREKGSDVWSVAPDTTVYDALRLMAEKNIGAVPVVEDERVLGIFSERDYARRMILKGRSSKITPISEVMTTRVVFVQPEQTMEECMSTMTDKRIRHLPVASDDGRLIGIISIGDVVKAIISEQEVMINHLEDYIVGKKG